MNKYRVWYTYTVADCDCPEVLVLDDHNYVDIEAYSEDGARTYLFKDYYFTRVYDNVQVRKVMLLDKDVHRIERLEINGVKHLRGLAASFNVKGREVGVFANDMSELQYVGECIFGEKFELDTSKVISVEVKKIDDK